MQTIDINLAQPQLKSIVHNLHESPVVLSENGHPVAMIVPCPPVSKEPRKPGILAGQIVIHEDFDDPLPDDIRQAFE